MVETTGSFLKNHNANKWFAMFFHDFSMTSTPSQKLLPGCWPQYHPRSWRPSSCCGTACVSDKTPRPWRKKEIFFSGGRLGDLEDSYPFPFCIFWYFFVGRFVSFFTQIQLGSSFQKSNDWHVEPEHRAQQKLSCLSKYRDSFPLSNFWFCQTLVFPLFTFEKKKKKRRKTPQLCKRHPQSLLIENGLVQDRNRLVKWSNSMKDGKKGTLQKKKTHGTWKIHQFCFLFGNEWTWHNMFDRRTSRNHLLSS